MNIIIDLDDFSPKNTNFGLLESLREHYPNFKVTLFTVPWEIRFGGRLGDPGTRITDDWYIPFCEAVIKSKDWIEIALHGLTHAPEEFLTLDYDDAKKRILVGEKMLINRKIPYTKLFKAPFWQLSEAGKKAAEDLGFKVAEDHYYNWNLKDPMPEVTVSNYTSLIAHGHIQRTSDNGLEDVIHKLMDLPTDTKFHFLSEHFGSERVDPSVIDWRDPMERVKITIDGKELA